MLLVDGAGPDAGAADSARRVLAILLRELPLKQAVKLAAEIGGGKRNELYRIGLEIKKDGEQ